MPIQKRLAFAQGRKDQQPNRLLAQEICDAGDTVLLEELKSLFVQNLDKRLLMDAALAIAYVGEFAPNMLSGSFDFLIKNLKHPVSRVNWGAMISLYHIAPLKATEMYHHLPAILDCMDGGGVVGRNYGFKILVTLYGHDDFREDVFIIILEVLSKAPPNQLGYYAELIRNVLVQHHKEQLVRVLEDCLGELTNDHHINRVKRNLKKLYK